MRVLNDYAIITDDLEDSNGAQLLDTSLLKEYERVKLTLEPLTLEDVAKVWTALNRPYRLSAAYEVSVVQIESTRHQRHAQLVGTPPAAGPRVATSAAGFPVIDEVHAATRLGPYAQVNDSLVVTGSALAGDPTLRLDRRHPVPAVRHERALRPCHRRRSGRSPPPAWHPLPAHRPWSNARRTADSTCGAEVEHRGLRARARDHRRGGSERPAAPARAGQPPIALTPSA